MWGMREIKSQRGFVMKIFVTGYAGFIGYHVCRLLLEQGHTVIGVDNFNDYYSVKLKNEPRHLATALYKLSYNSAKISKATLKKTEGMKAFFINDPSHAMQEVRELKDIDIDMSGTIDKNELDLLSTKKIKLHTSDKLLEVLSTHPNMLKRIKHLSNLSLGKET